MSTQNSAVIRNFTNANHIVVSTARIESGEKHVLLNQLIKEKVEKGVESSWSEWIVLSENIWFKHHTLEKKVRCHAV